MKCFFLVALLVWGLGAGGMARAQQILCERQLPANTPRYQKPATLLRLAPDSLRLVGDYFPMGAANSLQTRVQRLNLTNCDTLPAGATVLRVSHTDGSTSLAATNRRGQVLTAQSLTRALAAGAYDSARIVLQLFNRDGSTSRWRRTLVPQSVGEGISGIIEAPENGFFLFGGEFHPAPPGPGTVYDIVLRLDSTGRELWRRRYRTSNGVPLANPTYTRSGTLVITASYTASGMAPVMVLKEFSQRGDSLTTRPVLIVAQQYTLPTPGIPGSLLPLRDGGFALVGVVDSANTGYTRPFLARLDRNLNLVWSYIHRQRLANFFAQPQELADGSLVVVASNAQSGRGYPFWLFRFAATGTLQQRYPFVSQVLTANTSGGRYGFFGVAQGLQPLSDSSLVVVAGNSDLNSSRVYLAHLRVPGLPRVIDSHLVPPATPLATRRPRPDDADLDLYPNPAREALFVRFPHPARLVLRDALGRPRAHWTLPGGTAPHRLPLAHLPPGLYLATLEVDGQVPLTRKLLLGP